MLCLSGFELYSRWVPLHRGQFLGSPDITNGPKKLLLLAFKIYYATLSQLSVKESLFER